MGPLHKHVFNPHWIVNQFLNHWLNHSLNNSHNVIQMGHTFWCPVFNTYDCKMRLMMCLFYDFWEIRVITRICHLPFCLFQTVSNLGSHENRFKTVALYDPDIHDSPDITYILRCTKIFHLPENGFKSVRQPPLRPPIFQTNNKSCIINKEPFSEHWKTITSTA